MPPQEGGEKAGKLRGIGIGCYLEIAGAFPEEAARITFPGGKAVTVSIGAGASGQGHQTVFGEVAARRLGIAAGAVTCSSGDSARDVPGFGAVASRSAMMVGGAVANTADTVIDKGKRVAAMLLQADDSRGRHTRRQIQREEPRECRCSTWPSARRAEAAA